MSRGIAATKPGEVFSNDRGEKLVFDKVFLFPSMDTTGRKAVTTPDELEGAIANAQKKFGFSVSQRIGVPKSNTLAAMIPVFKNKQGKKVGFLKYFTTMNSNGYGKWSDKEFLGDTGFKAEGNKQSSFEALPIKPSDLVGDEQPRTVGALVRKVMSSIDMLESSNKLPPMVAEHLRLTVKAVASGSSKFPVLKGGKEYAPVYDKYLGEILAPLAVAKASNVTGDYAIAEKTLLSPEKFGLCTISFSTSANNGLYDSLLTSPAGKKVMISSKAGGGGAAASIGSLYSSLENLKAKNPRAFQNLVKKHQDHYNMLATIHTNNAIIGVLKVAIIEGIISANESKIIETLLANKSNLQQAKAMITPRLDRIAAGYGNVPMSKITPGMLAKQRGGDSYAPGYHLLAAVAKQIEIKVNSDASFQQFIQDILKYESLIQVNSSVVILGNDCQFGPFVITYPPKFDGKIKLNASKNYLATGLPRGKLSFKIVASSGVKEVEG